MLFFPVPTLRLFFYFCLVLACIVTRPVDAGQNGLLSKKKLKAAEALAPPIIDGDLADTTWRVAAKADTFSDAFTGSPEIDQTEAWICYDETAIYVAFHCHDSQPDSIVAREIRRDARFIGEDTVSFYLDPYRTRRGDDTNRFVTNALGTPYSYLAGGRAGKAEWKGEWECAARRVEDGWVAEMAIPWRILNFPSRTQPATLGINFRRQQERTKVDSYWSNLGPQRLSVLAGDWEEVRLPKSTFKRQLSLLPFTTTNYSLFPGQKFIPGLGREKLFNLGLDARMAVTPELTAVGTLNPDFSTVEGAVAGIDFTRGERFVPDVRPFFREGDDFFDVTLSQGRGWGDAFFSGRIPAFDGGAKVYGRHGPRDSIAVLGTANLQDRRGDLVGRWIHDIGQNAFVGGYLVQRSLPGDANTVVGVNESIRKGLWLIRSDVATSMGDGSGGGAYNGGVRWDGDRFHLNLGYTRVDPRFRAANGFVRFTDFQGLDGSIRYHDEWRTGQLRELNVSVAGVTHTRTNGAFFRRALDLSASAETRGDWYFGAGWERGRFEDERDSEFSLRAIRNISNRRNRIGLTYNFGKRADEPISFVAPFISRRLFGSWDVSISSSLLSHTERRSLHMIGFNREFDSVRALGGRVLIRDGALSYFLSYRVAGGRGLETYIVLGDPSGGTRPSRTGFITKFVYPLSL